jgi:tetratricopeptide (TPR) repeat protein
MLERLVSDYPEVSEHRHELANVRSQLASLLKDTLRMDEAVTEYRMSLASREQLAAESPESPVYQSGLAATLHNLAMILEEQGKNLQAIELLQRAIPHQAVALQQLPGHATYRRFFRNHHKVLAKLQLQQNDHAGAAQTVLALLETLPDLEHDYVVVAQLLARCYERAEGDVLLPESTRHAVAKAYADRALDLLRAAVSRRFATVASLKNDKVLGVMQSHAAFQQFLKGTP